jgi:hypothetical protein
MKTIGHGDGGGQDAAGAFILFESMVQPRGDSDSDLRLYSPSLSIRNKPVARGSNLKVDGAAHSKEHIHDHTAQSQ